jgi:hypothetical protein
MIQPETVSPNNDWCVVCGGCATCVMHLVLFSVFFVAGQLG